MAYTLSIMLVQNECNFTVLKYKELKRDYRRLNIEAQ